MTSINLLNHLLVRVPNYLMAWSSDRLPIPPMMADTYFTIVNLSPSYVEGSHFAAMIMKRHLNSKLTLWYYDPIGIGIIVDPILEWVSNHVSTLYVNTRQIQPFNSVLCGQYCAAYILSAFHYNHPAVLHQYMDSNEIETNDVRVMRFIQKHLL